MHKMSAVIKYRFSHNFRGIQLLLKKNSPGVETMIWHRVRIARRKSLWTWTGWMKETQNKPFFFISSIIISTLHISTEESCSLTLTILLCQQPTRLNVKLFLADLLFEPQLQVCPVTAGRKQEASTNTHITQVHLQHKVMLDTGRNTRIHTHKHHLHVITSLYRVIHVLLTFKITNTQQCCSCFFHSSSLS